MTNLTGRPTFKDGKLVTPAKGGWQGESKRHSLAKQGIKTGRKTRTTIKPPTPVEKVSGPTTRETYDEYIDDLMNSELENNTQYYDKEIDYDTWEENNDIINLTKTNLQKYNTTDEMDDFMGLSNDALKGINKMGFYYKVGAMDKIKGIKYE